MQAINVLLKRQLKRTNWNRHVSTEAIIRCAELQLMVLHVRLLFRLSGQCSTYRVSLGFIILRLKYLYLFVKHSLFTGVHSTKHFADEIFICALLLTSWFYRTSVHLQSLFTSEPRGINNTTFEWKNDFDAFNRFNAHRPIAQSSNVKLASDLHI